MMALVTPDSRRAAHLRFASRAPSGEGGRTRSLRASRLRAAWPRSSNATCKSALARGETAKAAPLAAAPSADATRKFFEAGSLRGNSARQCAQGDRAAADGSRSRPFRISISTSTARSTRCCACARISTPPRRSASDGKPTWKTSVNDYVVKALAIALQRKPEANVTYTPDALLRHKSSDIGVAVSIPGGLVTPIIRNAAGEIGSRDFRRDQGACRARPRAQAEAA